MRQFIKTHPWRLEIVPAIAFIIAVGANIFYHTQIIGHSQVLAVRAGMREQADYQLITGLALIVFLWVLEGTWNHKWVMMEARKRFNWWPLINQSVMLIFAWVLIIVSWMLAILSNPAMLHTYRKGLISEMLYLGGCFLIFGLGFTALMESTRRFVPKELFVEPPPPTGIEAQGNSFRYVEKTIDWGLIASTVAMMLFIVTSMLFKREHILLMISLLAFGVLLFHLKQRIIVTPESVYCSFGMSKRQVAISEIECARPVHCQLLERLGQKRVRAFGNTTGRCLELTMKNGKVHVFGMLRPAYACKLLERAGVQCAGDGD